MPFAILFLPLNTACFCPKNLALTGREGAASSIFKKVTDNAKFTATLPTAPVDVKGWEIESLTVKGWKDKIESHSFRTEQKYGKMTLLDPAGMIRDEGPSGAMKILSNAMKKENRQMFTAMFDFFEEHSEQFGYVANFSVKVK